MKPGSSVKIGRTLRRFRAPGVLKRIPGIRQHYLNKRGVRLLVVGRHLTERIILPALAA